MEKRDVLRTGLKWREAGQEGRKRSHNLLTSAVHFYVHIKYGNLFLNILETVLKILGVNNIKDFKRWTLYLYIISCYII